MKDPARVLVIDDDEDVRTLVRTLAQGAGYTAAEAPDGRAGLRSLHALPPDVVILDVSMPASTAGRRSSGSATSRTSRF